MARRAQPSSGCVEFETSLGPCGLVWSGSQLTDLLLPEKTRAALRASLRDRCPHPNRAEPPAWVRRIVGKLQRHLSGALQDLSDLPIALDELSPFARRVYRALRRVKPGETITYGELAKRAGSPGGARAVGRAMARNPLPLIVPCHRVLAAGGRVGGFSAAGGTDTKVALLRLEGAEPGKGLFDGSRPLGFDATRARRSLRKADATLGRLMAQIGPFKLQLKPARGTVASLAEAIVYQQLTTRAGATIFARLRGLPCLGSRITAAGLVAASDTELRAVGLSGAKQAALRDLAARSLAGTVPELARLEQMDDEEIIDSLTAIRGVGRWTAEMLLMFQLGRPDVLPVADYALRKGFARRYGRAELPAPREFAEFGERWRPYRTVASWYLWRSLELPD